MKLAPQTFLVTQQIVPTSPINYVLGPLLLHKNAIANTLDEHDLNNVCHKEISPFLSPKACHHLQ
jgi:hypothetical protein